MMNHDDLMMTWYASTHIKRGSMSKRDKSELKGLAVILGVVLVGSLVCLLLYASCF